VQTSSAPIHARDAVTRTGGGATTDGCGGPRARCWLGVSSGRRTFWRSSATRPSARPASSTLPRPSRSFPSGRSRIPDGPSSWATPSAPPTASRIPAASWRGPRPTARGRCTGPACPARNTVRRSSGPPRSAARVVVASSRPTVATTYRRRPTGGVPPRNRPPRRRRTYNA